MASGSNAARVVAALVVLLLASVAALPSGNVVKLSPGGYFKLNSLTGFSAISSNSAWTISAWIYAPTTSADFAVFTFGPNGVCWGEGGMGVYTWTATKGLTILACNADGTQGTTVLTGAWHHIAITHGSSTSVSKGYIDGAAEWTSTTALGLNPVIGLIGARTADSTPKALGTFWFDDIRVWSRALAQSEVRFDMHGGASLTGLLLNMDGSSVGNAGTKLIDLANGNNAISTGTTPTYTTTARCPVSTYISSCGMLSCRYLLADATIPMCGPCSRGFTSAIFANLTGYCSLDLPNEPTYATAATSSTSGCIDVSAQWPLISALITSFTVTRLDTGAITVVSAGVATSTATATICGLSAGVTYSFMVNATNAAGTGPGVVVTGTASGCAVGYYASSVGQCDACAAGTFSATTGATACTFCDAGQYAAKGASTCQDCDYGYFSAAAGSSVCSACAAGTASYATAATTCMTCWAGYYSATAASSRCIDCDFDEYALAGATTCTACAAGTWTTDTGSSACTGCAAGTYQKTSGTVTSCVTCAAGSYAAIGATACTTCAIGTYSTTSSSSACTTCAPGTRATGTGATTCVVCNAGTYGPAEAKGAYCILCPSGRFAPTTGYSVCTQCAVGMYQCSKASTTCAVCAIGKYASIVGRSECTSCPTGRYAATTSSTYCNYCAAGTYAEATGKSVCTSCAAGSYASRFASTCTDCAAGKYASAASALCTSCSAGSYAASSSSSTCTLCASGSYTATAGSTTCATCVKASAQVTGASTCTGSSSMLQHN